MNTIKEKDGLYAVFKNERQVTPYIYEHIHEYKGDFAVATLHYDRIENKRFVDEAKPYDGTEHAIVYAPEDAYFKNVRCFLDRDGVVFQNAYFARISSRTIDGFYELETTPYHYHIMTPENEIVFTDYNFVYKQSVSKDERVLFVDGLAKVSIHPPDEEYKRYGHINLVGFVNEKFEWIIEPKYHHLSEFVDGYAKFYQHDVTNCYEYQPGYIDKEGNEYIPRLQDGHVHFSTEDGRVGSMKTYQDFYQLPDEVFAHKFEDGTYGYVGQDGKVLSETRYAYALPRLWGGIGFVSNGDKWAIVDATGNLSSEYCYDAAGHVGEGYICARKDGISYLIGKDGVIHQKKNGFYGYKFKPDLGATEKRWSCGVHIHFQFAKVDAFKGFHSGIWVGVDEYDKQINGTKVGWFTQYSATYEIAYDFLQHHEESDTYYFVIGNKYGVDIYGNQVVLADLKEELEEVDIQSYLSLFSVYYPDLRLPQLWKDLIKNGWVWQVPQVGHADCSFSRSIQIRKVDKHDRDILNSYTTVKTRQKKLKQTFCFLAQADGTGGLFFYYLFHKDTPLEEQPIVFFGSEGEINVIASNLNEFLMLMSSDCEVLGDDSFDSKSLASFEDCDESETTYLADYREWLKENGLQEKLTKKERKSIIQKASETYGDALFDFMREIQK